MVRAHISSDLLWYSILCGLWLDGCCWERLSSMMIAIRVRARLMRKNANSLYAPCLKRKGLMRFLPMRIPLCLLFNPLTWYVNLVVLPLYSPRWFLLVVSLGFLPFPTSLITGEGKLPSELHGSSALSVSPLERLPHLLAWSESVTFWQVSVPILPSLSATLSSMNNVLVKLVSATESLFKCRTRSVNRRSDCCLLNSWDFHGVQLCS